MVRTLSTLYAHAEITDSNPLSRTKIILTSLNKLYLRIPICTNVAQLVSALPTLYAHAEIGGSNPLSRTKTIPPFE